MKTLWSRFCSSPLGELLTGTAHHTHPTDITAPLGSRFAGSTILALHVALEKAATVRVAFDAAGVPRLSGIRHIRQRSSAELGDVLRSEAAATRARWVVVVFATGWQAVLGQRAARPEAGERATQFFRHRLLFDSPELLVPRAQVDRVYTAIDHPVLDKSVVFSMRRRELEELLGEVRKCGLGIAAVRIGVAAQLEAWLATQGEAGLSRDVLVTDGLSALLLNVQQGDFVLPHSAIEAEQPRQAVQRPSAIEEDIARFISASPGRSVTYIGPDELCAAVKKAAPGAEIVRLPEHPAHDTQQVTLAAAVLHDLNCEAREVRPALPRSWRRLVLGYVCLVVVLAAVAAINISYAIQTGIDSYRQEKLASRNAAEADAEAEASRRMAAEFAEATAWKNWVGANYNAQQLCQRVLLGVPATAALDRLSVEVRDGQIALSFVIQGDQETQLTTHRQVERAVNSLRYRIGSEDLPTVAAAANRAVHYRMHIIVPDAGEVAR